MRKRVAGAASSARSASASIVSGVERSNPSSPGVRSARTTSTPRSANRRARATPFFDAGPDAKPWRYRITSPAVRHVVQVERGVVARELLARLDVAFRDGDPARVVGVVEAVRLVGVVEEARVVAA